MFKFCMDSVEFLVAVMAFVVDEGGCLTGLVVVIFGVDRIDFLEQLGLSCLYLFSVYEIAVLLCFFEVFDLYLQFIQEVSLLHQWT